MWGEQPEEDKSPVLSVEGQVRDTNQLRDARRGSEGLPDKMSCAGIFGSDVTKTVVIEHHKMNGFRSSPSDLRPRSSEPVTGPAGIMSDIWTKAVGEASRIRRIKQPWVYRQTRGECPSVSR